MGSVNTIIMFIFVKVLIGRVRYQGMMAFVMAAGTLISGTVFLSSAAVIAGLPGDFSKLFISIVLPTVLLNTAAGMILYNAVNISMKRSNFNHQ